MSEWRGVLTHLPSFKMLLTGSAKCSLAANFIILSHMVMFRHSLNKWVFKHSLYGWAITNSSDHLVLIVEQRQETSVIPLCRKTFNAYSLCMAINTIVITSVGLSFIQTCVSRHWAVVILETSQGWQKKKHQGLYESLCFCHITQPTFFSSTEFGSNTEGKKRNIKKQTEGISFKKCDVFPTIRTVKSTLQRKNVPMVITQPVLCKF